MTKYPTKNELMDKKGCFGSQLQREKVRYGWEDTTEGNRHRKLSGHISFTHRKQRENQTWSKALNSQSWLPVTYFLQDVSTTSTNSTTYWGPKYSNT